jgi:hypothetical protein
LVRAKAAKSRLRRLTRRQKLVQEAAGERPLVRLKTHGTRIRECSGSSSRRSPRRKPRYLGTEAPFKEPFKTSTDTRGLPMDAEVWHPTVFTHNRDRTTAARVRAKRLQMPQVIPLRMKHCALWGGGIWQLDRRAPGGPTDFFNVDFDFEHLRSGGKRQGPGQTLPAKISRINPRGQRRSGTFGAK